jgi:hypothetical protein
LHHLFGRLFARYHVLDLHMVQKIFETIIFNPAFDVKCLEIKNAGRLMPLDLLKRESQEYKILFNKILLTKRLQENLKISDKKIKKIKI